jgi:Icc-related predicted phosphoesterase
MRFGKRKHRAKETTRIFFATDVHGSDRCFGKFLNAARFYQANTLVLGGDITGKSLVPVERTNGNASWRASFRGNQFSELTDHEVADLEKDIRAVGMYPIRGTREELMALDDPEERERVFVEAVVEQMGRWMETAEERLAGSGVRCLLAPGNDDPFEIDAPLQGSDVVDFAEGRRVTLEDGTEVIVTGYSNQTPWKTPRELPESELAERLEGMFADVKDPSRLVLVAHAPPLGTTLDQAPKINEEFRVQMDVGAVRMASVGSSAVRDFIEKREPLLGLHGHVHDSKGIETVAKTICVNPGSEYADGVLCGAIIGIADGEITSCQLVTG